MKSRNLDLVEDLMVKFAYETGLTSGLKPRRYLWTDAFAVCNFLELYRLKGDLKFRRLALKRFKRRGRGKAPYYWRFEDR